MKTIKEILDAKNMTVADAAKKGCNYDLLYKQYYGKRKVGVRSALLYEKVLGIPKEELRPDIWGSYAIQQD